MKKVICLVFVGLLLISFTGCATTKVTRTATDEVIDLSGRWNDSDSRMTAEVLISDVLTRPWLLDFVEAEGEKPVVIVGTIRNKSSEHIDLSPLIKNFERELINSGKVRFVANKQERDEVREERDDQQSNSSEETAARLADETGADFMLQGVITTLVDAIDGKKVTLYQTNMELIDLRSNEKKWLGEHQIKKFVEKAKASW